jgi:hypothetical protein
LSLVLATIGVALFTLDEAFALEETAVALQVSDRTIKRERRLARAWLQLELTGSE